MNPVIYAADIGSIKSGNFGWARIDPENDAAEVERNDGSEIEGLVDAVEHDLVDSGRGVALGFECPLFVPVPRDAIRLGAARPGEGNRPWSGGPGTAALATGMVQTLWVLRQLRGRCPDVAATSDWDEFSRVGHGLFLWEAFVTGKAKSATHVDDALIAAKTFRDALPDPPAANAVDAERPFSLIGAALVWSGWSKDAALLHKPCLVIKAATSVAPTGKAKRKATQATARKQARPSGSLRDSVIRVASQIPAGKWTTYGDLAKLEEVRASPIGVGGLIGDGGVPNDHRVLKHTGKFSEGAPASHLEKLKAEGVRFINGRADPRQKWCPE